MNHPNIVKLLDVFHEADLLYFVLEYGNVDLHDLIIKERQNIELKPHHIKCIIKQILEGISHLHSK